MLRLDPTKLTYSKSGVSLTESFEQCRLAAYIPTKGDVPTIGWGHTAGVKLGDTCTQEQADAWLLDDVQVSVHNVQRHVHVPLTQGEFDALVDFDFNCGDGNFFHSTLLALINEGKYEEAAAQFERWDRSGGVVLAGLLRRRVAEEKAFTLQDAQENGTQAS